jgi:hypothetical protein
VQSEVDALAATVRHQQQPAFYDQIIGEIELSPAAATAAPAPLAAPTPAPASEATAPAPEPETPVAVVAPLVPVTAPAAAEPDLVIMRETFYARRADALLRKGPSADSDEVAKLEPDTAFISTAASQNDGHDRWYKIKLTDGREGFAYGSDLIREKDYDEWQEDRRMAKYADGIFDRAKSENNGKLAANFGVYQSLTCTDDYDSGVLVWFDGLTMKQFEFKTLPGGTGQNDHQLTFYKTFKSTGGAIDWYKKGDECCVAFFKGEMLHHPIFTGGQVHYSTYKKCDERNGRRALERWREELSARTDE